MCVYTNMRLNNTTQFVVLWDTELCWVYCYVEKAEKHWTTNKS
jgi:hypothetical protein